MVILCCPLCSTPLEPSALEAHLRYELRYPLAACSLCPMTFCGEAEADKHFTGPLAKHPGMEVQLVGNPSDPVKEERLVELVRLARGGPEAAQERLCVCGQCRLLCREEFRPTQTPITRTQDIGAPHPVIRPRDYRVKTSPDSDIQYSARALPQYREEATPDPAFRFARDLGPLRPAQFGHPDREAPDNLADESEPREMSDRSDQEPHGQEFDGQQDWQPSEDEVPAATKRKSSPKATSVKRKSSPKASRKKSSPKPQAKGSSGSRKESTCRSCAKSVRNADFKEHVSRFHLKKPLYECKSCDFSLSNTNSGKMNRHVKHSKVKHGQTPGPETIDSAGLQQHMPVIEAMIHKLFDQ